MQIDFTDRERVALWELAQQMDLGELQVVRRGVRLAQLIERHRSEGWMMVFRNAAGEIKADPFDDGTGGCMGDEVLHL